MLNFLNKNLKINFFKNLKNFNLKLILEKELKVIKNFRLDVLYNLKEIKKFTLIKFSFYKEEKIINFPFKLSFLNEIKTYNFKLICLKSEVNELLKKYENNIFITKNKDYIIKKFDFYFDAYNFHNNTNRIKLISDLNKFLYWIDSNNFYYINQIDTIDYKNFWRL